MRVEVYRNLHTGTWSVRDLEPGSPTRGRVIDHPGSVILDHPEFVVQPAGRERVRREGQKNVHAFVRGELVDEVPEFSVEIGEQVTYNPYKNDSFVLKSRQHVPVNFARLALLFPGSVWAYWEAPSWV